MTFQIKLLAFLLRNGYLQVCPQTLPPTPPRRMPQEPTQARARRQSAGDDQKGPNTGTVTDFLHVHAED